jgi:protein tyrosine phosphatase
VRVNRSRNETSLSSALPSEFEYVNQQVPFAASEDLPVHFPSGSSEVNKNKNRYWNVLPYESNRIVLQSDGEEGENGEECLSFVSFIFIQFFFFRLLKVPTI